MAQFSNTGFAGSRQKGMGPTLSDLLRDKRHAYDVFVQRGDLISAGRAAKSVQIYEALVERLGGDTLNAKVSVEAYALATSGKRVDIRA